MDLGTGKWAGMSSQEVPLRRPLCGSLIAISMRKRKHWLMTGLGLKLRYCSSDTPPPLCASQQGLSCNLLGVGVAELCEFQMLQQLI